MARQLQPRHITLGGRDAVALTPGEYEQLVASRRQIGGQSARVRVLAQQAKRTERLVRELELLIGDCAGDTCGAEPSADATCVRCAVAAALSRYRDAPAH
ncbi:hypothetical protein ACFWZ2_27355 [Streptomyces sp. NPDC059002]|uniref:hypothetical protein n=1 Tax=Streptomyces sp. NPDC059002 TaxID=3346690 RepID=UPI0036C17C6F